MSNTFDVEQFMDRDTLATAIANKWIDWKQQKAPWENEHKELRNYIFSTDTSTTENKALPWKNCTTVPKLTQIRDNLHANYMAALFPNENWLQWAAASDESVDKERKLKIEAYMRHVLRQSGFRTTVSQLVYDYIDNGNAFADVAQVVTRVNDPKTGESKVAYSGPKAMRISPYDMVFDPTAVSFEVSPKISRTILTLGELKKDAESSPDTDGWKQEILTKVVDKRTSFRMLDPADRQKADGFIMDGFGSYSEYLLSDYVELLEFDGTIYDLETDTLYENKLITVVDRNWIVRIVDRPAWSGKSYKQHAGWRLRPDNLWAMGPLDNLVGMQYRIDHLENLKADVFDMIAFPMIKVAGTVDDFEYAPGERIYVGEEGDVGFMSPDTTALNADLQIQIIEQRMEELAGAPKEAMGIRTPGEKTKFEVQSLQNAAGRIFQNKTSYFEEVLIEPLVNSMLEMARRNFEKVTVPFRDEDTGIIEFLDITREDLAVSGKFYPQGARHFAAQAQLVQNLNAFANSALGQDPSIIAHISGKKIAQLLEENMGLSEHGLYEENIRVMEQMETAQITQAAQKQLQAGIVADEDEEIDMAAEEIVEEDIAEEQEIEG